MSVRKFDTFSGELIVHTTRDYSSPKHIQFFRALEVWTQKYLRFFLGMAIVTLAWAWSSASQQTDYQALRDYAV